MKYLTPLYSMLERPHQSIDHNAAITDPELLSEYYRLRQYREYWRAYNNNVTPQRRKAATSTVVRINLAKAFVDRSTDFLMGNTPNILPPEKYTKAVSPVIDYIMKKSNASATLLSAATAGAILGDAFVKIFWDEVVKCVRFQILDPEYTFIKYEADGETVASVTVAWTGEYSGEATQGVTKKVLYKEVWTKDSYARTIEVTRAVSDGAITLPLKQFVGKILHNQPSYYVSENDVTEFDITDELKLSKKNDLGFIPIVHIRNLVVPMSIYGRSDITDLVDLNKSINEAATLYLDSVNYHGFPTIWIKGAKVGNLKRSPNNIWSGLPKDAEIGKLDPTQNFEAIEKFMEFLTDSAYLVGSIPEAASGLFQNISNTTGVALQVQYLPLSGLTKRKQASYGPAIEAMFEHALRIMDSKLKLGLGEKVSALAAVEDALDVEEMDDDETAIDEIYKQIKKTLDDADKNIYKVDVQWVDYLPKDSLQALNEIEREVDLGIESRSGALRKRGCTDPAAKLREIDRENSKNPPNETTPTPDNTGAFDELNGAGEEGGAAPEDQASAEELAARKAEEQNSPDLLATKQG